MRKLLFHEQIRRQNLATKYFKKIPNTLMPPCRLGFDGILEWSINFDTKKPGCARLNRIISLGDDTFWAGSLSEHAISNSNISSVRFFRIAQHDWGNPHGGFYHERKYEVSQLQIHSVNRKGISIGWSSSTSLYHERARLLPNLIIFMVYERSSNSLQQKILREIGMSSIAQS